MDKLITAVTIVVVVGLFAWLHQQSQGPMPSHVWAATVNGQTIGTYADYHGCVAAVKSQADVGRTPYDCALVAHP